MGITGSRPTEPPLQCPLRKQGEKSRPPQLAWAQHQQFRLGLRQGSGGLGSRQRLPQGWALCPFLEDLGLDISHSVQGMKALGQSAGYPALGVPGGMGWGKAAGSQGEDEGWSGDRSMDVSMSPENGLVQARGDGQHFQGSSCSPQEEKSSPRSITQSSQVQASTDPKENHRRCALLPPRASTGLSQDGLRSETSASGEI